MTTTTTETVRTGDPAPATLDVEHTRTRFTPLRDAFLVERNSKDFLSLHRVTADVVRPLLYTGARIELDFLLRSLAAEFLPTLVSEVVETAPYYPTGEGAWTTSFPTLEERRVLDNRYCAFGIVSLIADTCPAVSRRLAKEEGFVKGLLRLMFAMYVRANNPLRVEDTNSETNNNHAHIASSSTEPRIWQPQARSIISLLLILTIHDGATLKTAWSQVLEETQAGAAKVQVKQGATILDSLTGAIKTFEEKGVDKLNDEERRTLSDFSTFLTLVLGESNVEMEGRKMIEELRKGYEKDRYMGVACSGCGKIFEGEKVLQACSRCRIILYCSSECQTMDWKRYHKETCSCT